MMPPSLRFVELSGTTRRLRPVPAPIASGADGAIHLAEGETGLVLKLYHDPEKDPGRLEKLQAMMADPPDLPAVEQAGRSYAQIAWPKGWLTDAGGRFLGFAMPRIDLAAAVSLEHLLSRKTRVAFGLSDSYGARVAAASNLASVVAELHAHGHHVIDLKPINLNVYKDTFLVSVLDCDGFSIKGAGGERFPAHQYSDGYICPAALQRQLPPSALGEDQDRFALAVIIFQLLNQGLHPYQGIPAPGAAVPPTNNERVQMELYAYGFSGNPVLRPSPWSIHEFLDDESRRLFDRAFTSRYDRPTAREWRDHLLPYADRKSGKLTVCSKDRSHVHFGRRCPWCFLEDRQRRPVSQPSARTHAAPRAPATGSTAGPALTLNQGHFCIFVHTRLNLSAAEEAKIERWVAEKLRRVMITNPGAAHVNVTRRPGRARRLNIRWQIRPTQMAPHTARRASPSPAAGVNQTRGARPGVARQPTPGPAPSSDRLRTFVLWILFFVFVGIPVIATLLSLGDRAPEAGQDALETEVRDIDADAQGYSDRPPLMEAVRTGNAERVKELLGRPGVDVDLANGDGWTALHFTVEGKSRAADFADIATMLIAAGADVDARTKFGNTPLKLAVMNGKPKTLAALIAAGADPDIADDDGLTPLMAAAAQGKDQLITALLAARADADATDNFNGTALMHAAKGGDAKSVKALLAVSANVNLADKSGRTALHFTVSDLDPRHDHDEAARLLIAAGADMKAMDNWGQPPLHVAALNHKPKTLAAMLQAGADPDLRDSYGGTALLDAAYAGNVEAVDVLLEAHADVNIAADYGWTALHFTVFDVHDPGSDFAGIAKRLIAAGARINVRNKMGDAPLHLAVRHQKAKPLAVLLAAGADPNVRDAKGSTPLMLAANAGDARLVNALLAARADVTIANEHGWTALHFAAGDEKKDYDDIAIRLIAAGAPIDARNVVGETPLHLAAMAQKNKTLAVLLAAGADPNLSGKAGLTPLMHTVAHGDREMFNALLEHGAKVSLADDEGRTALHFTAGEQANAGVDYREFVTLLFERGADVDAKDGDGFTSLMLAAKNGHAATVGALIGVDADVSIKNTADKGRIALDYALDRGYEEIAGMLAAPQR